MKIVVIDDSELVLALTAAALQSAGMQVVTLTTPLGSTATILEERPDLVLLDVAMPALSGERAAEILKRRTAFKGLKVALYSDLDEAELALAAKRCGADGFIKKSKDPFHLVAEIRRLVAK